MRKSVRARDPLEPLDSVVSTVLFYSGTVVIVATLTTIFGSGSILGFGQRSLCTDRGGWQYGLGWADDLHLAPGVRVSSAGIRLCTDHPTTGQHLLSALNQGPGLLILLAGLTLVWLVIQHATSHDIFSRGVAGRLRVLGRFLIVGAVVEFVVANYAAMRLQESMTGDSGGVFDPKSIPWSTILMGVAALTFARVVLVGTAMRNKLDDLAESGVVPNQNSRTGAPVSLSTSDE